MTWLKVDPSFFIKEIDTSLGFILKQAKDGGRFGSTQATILSLKALIDYADIFGGVKGSGKFTMYLNNH